MNTYGFTTSISKKAPGVVVAAAVALATASSAMASHQWNSYHWERPDADPLSLKVGDNHTHVSDANWSSLLSSVVRDWDDYSGSYLTAGKKRGGNRDIDSYNDDYGDTGWLGIASIWVTVGSDKHIVAGISRVNDYYVSEPDGYDGFNEPVEWEHVLCQEIGHTFGLDHNREGSSGGTPDDTCMNDETRPLRYPMPNEHDTEQLNIIYEHHHGSEGGNGGGGHGPGGCHPVFGCAGAVGVVWAEHYETEEEMFEAADLVVATTVLSSSFDRDAGRGAAAVPITNVIFRVTETFSGFSRPVIVLEQTRGRGLELRDDPGYVTGDDYILYLREIGSNIYRTVNPDGRIRL